MFDLKRHFPSRILAYVIISGPCKETACGPELAPFRQPTLKVFISL